jgi:hypothetical protein
MPSALGCTEEVTQETSGYPLSNVVIGWHDRSIERPLPTPRFPVKTPKAGGYTQDGVPDLVKSHKVRHFLQYRGMADHPNLRAATATSRTNDPADAVPHTEFGNVVV